MKNLIKTINILIILIFIYGCSEKTQPTGPRMVPVKEGRVAAMTVPSQITAIGSVQAYITVTIKSMVAGEITGVYFKEGGEVRQGQMLFLIDPRTYTAALKQAEAQLARDTAQAKNAEQEAARYKGLVEKDYVSKDQYDQLKANADAMAALVAADKASVENSRVQLEYCSIRSPIDGRAGNILINLGNVVKANDLPILTINKVSPIYVAFSVPEQNLSEIKRHMSLGILKTAAIIPGDEKRPVSGALTFINNEVDSSTGTILLKATFTNADRRLWPGQFVNVVLTLSQQNAVVIPTSAVQAGQQGEYIFVIKDDMSVERREVTIASTYNEFSVIAKGAIPGERVVTDGQIQLVPGAKVQIVNGTVKPGDEAGKDKIKADRKAKNK